VDRLAVPIEAEPGETVEDRGDRRLGRARAVGVLDAQQELGPAPARVKPVEQRGARPADMQEAGGRGGEAGDDLGHAGRNLRPHAEERLKGASRSMAKARVAIL